MKSSFVSSWKASVQPRKQRKYRYNSPLHIKHKFLSSHLSAELRKQHGMRSLPVKKGDEVIIMRGNFAKKQGKVLKVNLRKSKIYVEGINRTKKDGSKIEVGLDPSKVKIVSLNKEDSRRLNVSGKADDKQEKKNASN